MYDEAIGDGVNNNKIRDKIRSAAVLPHLISRAAFWSDPIGHWT